ncbi:MAG TPA: DEAD/DEAH box helicase [Ktedonobacterales bacterium]|jgi:superfamily II DNA/RNA helicase
MALETTESTPTQSPATSFDQFPLSARSVQALTAADITIPTPIQAAALPPLLAGSDLIGQSRTGSGKTIAFGLPLVERIDPKSRTLQALIIVPTRELANQVGSVLRMLEAGRGIKLALLIGGRAIGPQREALAAGAHIAIGAPGRVLDHLRQGSLDLRHLKMVVLDEADQMLDAGFAPDVERILSRTPATRQTMLFSATMPEWASTLAARYLREPVRVATAGPGGRSAPAIQHVVYQVPEGNRMDALKALLDARDDADGVTLVFARTKHGVKRLAKKFEALGYPVAALQGNLSQNARDRVMEQFRAGQVRILLATNIAARGLDILEIGQVINYELPESAELFTHRVGRTGRMEREGEAITLLEPEDLAAWRKMQRDLRRDLPLRPWPQDRMPLPAPNPAAEAPSREPFPRRDQRPRPARMPASNGARPQAPARPQSQHEPRPASPAQHGSHGGYGARPAESRGAPARRRYSSF